MVVLRKMSRLLGPLLILIAALLWGTDSLFRYSLSQQVDATWIVLIEHLGILALIPWLIAKRGEQLFKLGWKEWFCAFIIGAGGGALATILFTASFQYIHPSVAILLQKLQPIFTVLIASVFLGEKPHSQFYPWAFLGLGAAVAISFPDFNFRFLLENENLKTQGLGLALASAGIWSIATVAGKRMLQSTTADLATFWRYVFGLLTLIILVGSANIPFPSEVLQSQPLQIKLAYVTLFSGIIPMLFYYGGLARTTASTATFVELAYPLSAIALNAWLLNQPLSPVQLGAGGLLLFSVTMISLI